MRQVDSNTGRVVAAKKARLGKIGVQPSVYAEIRSLQELHHENVVSVRLGGRKAAKCGLICLWCTVVDGCSAATQWKAVVGISVLCNGPE
jgi:hypothetical protein